MEDYAESSSTYGHSCPHWRRPSTGALAQLRVVLSPRYRCRPCADILAHHSLEHLLLFLAPRRLHTPRSRYKVNRTSETGPPPQLQTDYESFFNRSAAGCMKGEWNAPATAKGTARRIPKERALSESQAMSASVPASTIWAGALIPATDSLPPSPRRSAATDAATRGRRRSGPPCRTVHLPQRPPPSPGPVRRRGRDHLHRRWHRSRRGPCTRRASVRPMQPVGDGSASSRGRHSANEIAYSADWACSVRVSSFLGAVNDEPLQGPSDDAVCGLAEEVAAGPNRSAPMPTRWLPCPGKRTAYRDICIVLRSESIYRPRV